MCNRLGGMVGPYLGAYLVVQDTTIVLVLFASVLSAAAVSSLFLDIETKGQPLLERISEMSEPRLAEMDAAASKRATMFVKTPSGSFRFHPGGRLKRNKTRKRKERRASFEARWSAARVPS
jgi:hypothetical protein